MAIVKFNNPRTATNNNGADKLKRIIKYVTSREKTDSDLIGGIGVSEKNAFARMNTVKNFYNKTNGRGYIHFIVSPKGYIDPDLLYMAAEQISFYYKDYQILYAVHVNTNNTHIHFVLNTVCVTDGHKFSQSKNELAQFKDFVNSTLEKRGLTAEIELSYEDTYDFDSYYEDETYYEEELIEPILFDLGDNANDPVIFHIDEDGKLLIEPIIFDSESDRQKWLNGGRFDTPIL